MSQGSGPFGATKATVGISGAHIGAMPIRSLPSAPTPCSITTKASGLPPFAGPKRGPSSSIM
jgi:hypothetical protein